MRPCFVLTNDPDHASTEHTGRVFELLNRCGIRVTTAVFSVVKDSPCWLGRHCRPGETAGLADPEFRKLMLEQKRRGHEIAYHGYCQIGETREEFKAGLDEFRAIFGEYPYTYIEHGPNPHTHPGSQHKPNLLAAKGAEPESPYYILDLLRDRCRLVWTQEDLLGTHHFTSPTGPVLKEPVGFFRRKEDGLTHFLRYRLYLVQHEPFFRRLQNDRASFIGYTHFGYVYRGEWAWWSAERWDDLDGLNKDFWEWVSRAGFQFKTLKGFHLEEAVGASVLGSLADRKGGRGVSSARNGAGRVDPRLSYSPAPSENGLQKGETSTKDGSPPGDIGDPLETLGLGIQASRMHVQEKFSAPEGRLYWGFQIQVLDRLLQGCRTVLSIGEGDGRLLVPLAKRHDFSLTVVDPYLGGYEKLLDDLRLNLRLFETEDRCRIEKVSFHEYNPLSRFDAVVSLGLTLDECWKGCVADTPALLSKAYKMTNKRMVVELRQPITMPEFQNVLTMRQTFLSWTLKAPLEVSLPRLSPPASS